MALTEPPQKAIERASLLVRDQRQDVLDGGGARARHVRQGLASHLRLERSLVLGHVANVPHYGRVHFVAPPHLRRPWIGAGFAFDLSPALDVLVLGVVSGGALLGKCSSSGIGCGTSALKRGRGKE